MQAGHLDQLMQAGQKVAVGEYNKMIDKRMAEIKAECDL